MDHYFRDSFDDCQGRFRESLAPIRSHWPGACWLEFPLASPTGVAITAIEAEATVAPTKSLIITVGQHGIEGYVGSAMLELFVREFLPRLDPTNTSLLLVHPINPWGMKHRRRTNAHNVDLNRNFVTDPASLDPRSNPDYAIIERCLEPHSPIRSLGSARLRFATGLLCALLRLGPSRLRRAVLLGQYLSPRGLHYGGDSLQEETRVVMSLLREQAERHQQVLHLDMHTGYGPPHQMTIVNSHLEPVDSSSLARRFAYPRVAKTDSTEFYSILGDMIDWEYQTFQQAWPERHLYATAFEFGTVGESIGAVLGSLQTMLLENQAYWHGAPQGVRQQIETAFEALFFPHERERQSKAMADARQAFEGILRAEGFLAA